MCCEEVAIGCASYVKPKVVITVVEAIAHYVSMLGYLYEGNLQADRKELIAFKYISIGLPSGNSLLAKCCCSYVEFTPYQALPALNATTTYPTQCEWHLCVCLLLVRLCVFTSLACQTQVHASVFPLLIRSSSHVPAFPYLLPTFLHSPFAPPPLLLRCLKRQRPPLCL